MRKRDSRQVWDVCYMNLEPMLGARKICLCSSSRQHMLTNNTDAPVVFGNLASQKEAAIVAS